MSRRGFAAVPAELEPTLEILGRDNNNAPYGAAMKDANSGSLVTVIDAPGTSDDTFSRVEELRAWIMGLTIPSDFDVNVSAL